MRPPVDASRVERLMAELGRRSTGPGRVYLTGGASALLVGWRASTLDVDLKLDPEPPGAFEAIATLKNELDINVELASPDLFLPPVPGWAAASVPIATHGEVEFLHYDFRGQALSKIARGHDRDLADVRAMLARGLTSKEALREAFDAIRSELIRFPRLDERTLARRLDQVLG